MADNPPPQPAPVQPVQYIPPTPTNQYTETLNYNIDNADKIYDARVKNDSRFAALDAQSSATSADAGMANYTALLEKYGPQLAAASKRLTIDADPLGETRNNFITDQLASPGDLDTQTRLEDLGNSQFQDKDLLNALKGRGMEDIALGGNMSPEVEMELQERLRTAESARGQGTSTAATYRELLNKGAASEDLKRSRTAEAGNIQTLLQSGDQFGLQGKEGILSAIGANRQLNLGNKAAFLGLSVPTSTSMSSSLFGQGYNTAAPASPFAGSFGDNKTTADIYNSRGNFMASLYGSAESGYSSQYGAYQNNLSSNGIMGQVGQAVGIAGSLGSMAGAAMMM